MQPVNENGRTFWASATLEELASEQGVESVQDVRDLADEFWPNDEGPDDFVSRLRDQRRHA
jgi:hypothetical protein